MENGVGFQETIMWTPEEVMKAKSFSDSHAELVAKHCPGDSFMYKCTGQGIAFLTGTRLLHQEVKTLLEAH